MPWDINYPIFTGRNEDGSSITDFIEVGPPTGFACLETVAICRAVFGGSHEFLLARMQMKRSETLSCLNSGRVIIYLLGRLAVSWDRFDFSEDLEREWPPLCLSRWVKMLDFCFRLGTPVTYQLDKSVGLWSH